jgi:hypothetical protein
MSRPSPTCRRPPRAPIRWWRPVASGAVRWGPHIGHVAHAVIEHAASPVAVVAHDWPAAARTEPPWTVPSRAVAV